MTWPERIKLLGALGMLLLLHLLVLVWIPMAIVTYEVYQEKGWGPHMYQLVVPTVFCALWSTTGWYLLYLLYRDLWKRKTSPP